MTATVYHLPLTVL